MEMSLKKSELKDFLRFQLEHFFPDKYSFVGNDIDSSFELALDRTENCFKYIKVRNYKSGDNTTFSHLHGDQYAHFLYYFSNSLWKLSENKAICDKVAYLNRALHNFFFSYKGQLPDIFLFVHPIGTIIGNAHFENYLVICQNVTINTRAIRGGSEPKIAEGVFLGTGSKILGNSCIGKRVSIGTDVIIYNEIIPDDSTVYLDENKKVIRPRKHDTCMAQEYFNVTL